MDSSSPLIGGSQVASGVGLASITAGDDVLEVWFPNPQLGPRASDHIGIDETDDPVRKIRTRRLGAHLGSGTVIMHEGFVDFTAGTSSAAMGEGRIAEGALVGDGCQIGASADIGFSLGEGCQVGASANIGFSLGEGCQVEAALYLAESTSIRLDDGTIATGADLASQPRLRFYRDSLSDKVYATACATVCASVTS